MRIAVVLFPAEGDKKILGIGEALAKGIRKQGHAVTVINGVTEMGQTHLSPFDYIVAGVSPLGIFTAELLPQVSLFFKNAGTVAGKRSYAFVTKAGGLRRQKILLNLMRILEHGAMIQKWSGIIGSEREAERIGEKVQMGDKK